MKIISMQKIVENPKYKYTFEFDEIELALLLMYLNKTGGCPKKSYRAIADSVRNEILNAIAESNNEKIHYIVEKLRRTLCNEKDLNIRFKDSDDEN